MVRVACLQLAPRIGEPEANGRRATAALRGAVDAGADLVVLPELVTSGYVFASADEARSAAIGLDDPVLRGWSQAAGRGDAVVVGGFCELAEDGAVYNSAAVVDGSGVLAVYRKAHLWDREKLWFAAGPSAPVVVDTRVGRIGVAVCYDLEFAEVPRALALEGAELVCVPTNWPLVDRPDGERPPEVVAAMAAARANRVFVACCDRTGEERGQRWTEGTAIVGADGWVLDEAGPGEGAAWAQVDLADARAKDLTELAHCLDDRRPELYGRLVAS